MLKKDVPMFEFTKIFSVRGTTIYPGVVLKGDIIETDTTISLRGSDVFKDIPKDSVTPYIPKVFSKKTKCK